MKLLASAGSLDAAKEATHVIGVFEDGKNSDHAELLQQLSEADVFKGKKSSSYFVRAFGEGTSLLFIGLGKAKDVSGETLRCAGAVVTQRLNGEKVKAAAVSFESFRHKDVRKSLDAAKTARYLGEGLLLSTYSFDLYKSEKQPKTGLAQVSLVAEERKNANAVAEGVDAAKDVHEAVTIARDLSNEPSSVLTPLELASRAKKIAKENKLSCKVLGGKELKKEKMGGIIGVGQGSDNPPCLIVLEHKPKKAKKTIAFVGKAVTFDSGGISIKPGANMEDMKHDMSGGADVLAAIVLAARLGCPHHIVCVIAAAENMPSGGAIVPSTILTARSGKTVEVQNTDAEGRLILMDALDYAQDYKPAAIIDVATLTGAVVMALGNVAAGIMGNDPSLTKRFQDAAGETNERYWELPLYQEYRDDMKSKIADLKNIGAAGSGGGSQKGGAFLLEFIRPGNKWLHVDIAGTAWNQGYLPYQPKHGATGHTVRTLAQFAMDF